MLHDWKKSIEIKNSSFCAYEKNLKKKLIYQTLNFDLD